MIRIRPSEERGHFDFGWLDTHHTFSFGDYYDPAQMGFRSLRVINEDWIQAGQGFGMHGHRDMEILTWVLSGALEHKDSLGNTGIIRPGDAQRMSAGTGIRHSEYNASKTDSVHLLQIWLLPSERDLMPSYAQNSFPSEALLNRLQPIASPDGREGSVRWNQEAMVHAARLEPGAQLEIPLTMGRHYWVQIARGDIHLEQLPMSAGDGAALSSESNVRIEARTPSEFLLFDME